jgi:hypothetical protein
MCNKTKILNSTNFVKEYKIGFSVCKVCVPMSDNQKRCLKCKIIKNKDQFSPAINKKIGYRPNCKKCQALLHKLREQKNK